MLWEKYVIIELKIETLNVGQQETETEAEEKLGGITVESGYCGKSCDECISKTGLDCPGCKQGPGGPGPARCEIAQCCLEKGHEDCSTCTHMPFCGKVRGSGQMPESRMRKQKLERERMERTAQKADLLGKWLWILFWIMVPSSVSGLMTNDNVIGWFPGLYLPGTILNALCLAAYCYVLWKISPESDRYRTASICCAISAGVGLLIALAFGKEVPDWTLVITIPASVVALVGEYNEYMGHAEVLYDVEPELSERWEKLWKWFIGMFLGMFVSVFLILIIPVLGLLAFIVAGIGTVIVSVLKLVYLYQSARLFRAYAGKKNTVSFDE